MRVCVCQTCAFPQCQCFLCARTATSCVIFARAFGSRQHSQEARDSSILLHSQAQSSSAEAHSFESSVQCPSFTCSHSPLPSARAVCVTGNREQIFDNVVQAPPEKNQELHNALAWRHHALRTCSIAISWSGVGWLETQFLPFRVAAETRST